MIPPWACNVGACMCEIWHTSSHKIVSWQDPILKSWQSQVRHKGEQSLGAPDWWHLAVVPGSMGITSSSAILQSFSTATTASSLEQGVAVVESSPMILISSFRATVKTITMFFYMCRGIWNNKRVRGISSVLLMLLLLPSYFTILLYAYLLFYSILPSKL